MSTLKVINHFFGILGFLLLGIILSGEAARYFYGHDNLWQPYSAEYLLYAFLMIFWFALATVLLEIGLQFRSQVLAYTALCGLTLAVTATVFIGFPKRIEYQEAFNNPYSIMLIAESLLLLCLGWQSKFVQTYKKELGGFAVIGLYSLLAILTIEWYHYMRPLTLNEPPTLRSMALLWTLYALLWIIPGFVFRSMPLRVCGLIILFGTVIKTALFDSFNSLGYCSWQWKADPTEQWVPLLNPYFLTMLVPTVPAMFLAAWTNLNRQTSVGEKERLHWKTLGIGAIITLLIYLSVECYHYFDAFDNLIWGSASLTLLWTLFALVLTTLALAYRSPVLRIISITLLGLSVSKVLLLDIAFRPENMVPVLNPYCFPILCLAVMVMILGYLWSSRLKESETTEERNVYRVIAFFGVFLLWLAMSVECFQAVKLQTASQEAWKAQMALSILWSLFAGTLMVIGFWRRSSVLRWMAIILFAVTLLKVLAVDMSGVHELYRFGAVFVLALLLAFAAWTYQRFRPEG